MPSGGRQTRHSAVSPTPCCAPRTGRCCSCAASRRRAMEMAVSAPAKVSSGAGFWSVPEPDLLQALQSSAQGLSSREATQRLRAAGRHAPHRHRTPLVLLLRQFANPITLILVAATLIAAVL